MSEIARTSLSTQMSVTLDSARVVGVAGLVDVFNTCVLRRCAGTVDAEALGGIRVDAPSAFPSGCAG